MRKKKKWLLWLMIVIFSFTVGLSSCGSDPGESSTSESTKSEVNDNLEAKDTPSEAQKDTNTTEQSDQKEPDQPAPQPTGDITVHFLDVGQGLSILVQSNGENLVYDGGDRGESSFVVSYLQQHGVTDIKYLISSHYDEDHVAGLVGCVNTFNVENVIGADYVQDTKIYQSFIDGVAEKGLEIQHPAVGTEYQFGTGKFTILSPASIGSNDNDNSVAIKLTNGENSFIFTGDAESSSEAAMCSSGIDLSCDVLVPGHHGSATATSNDFLMKTVPEFAVISCGTDNQYGHPDKDTMDKLQSMDIQVYRTDEQGTVIATSNGTEITWNQDPSNDYSSGDSNDTGTQPQAVEEQPVVDPTPEPELTEEPETVGGSVWISETGSKYHNKPDCGRMNPDKARQITESEAQNMGLDACENCF